MSECIRRVLKDAGLEFLPAQYNKTGVHCELTLIPEALRNLVEKLKVHGFFLESVTAVDKIDDDLIEGWYLFNHYDEAARLQIKIPTPRLKPVLPSIAAIYEGAVWHEREAAEFFGITFEGATDTRHLLLPENAEFHPLRKDFSLRA